MEEEEQSDESSQVLETGWGVIKTLLGHKNSAGKHIDNTRGQKKTLNAWKWHLKQISSL